MREVGDRFRARRSNDRIASILDSVKNKVVVTYTHGGISRRVAASLGNGISQSFESGGALAGLDRFGRPIDLHFTRAGATVHRYQHGYDQAGKRTHARVTQATLPGAPAIPHDNDRSWLYGYDELNRLVSANCGTLSGERGSPAITTPPPAGLPITTEWLLDSVDNGVMAT